MTETTARLSVPLRRHSKANRLLLMRAVADLLAERGMSFSLTDVAERAGTSVATSYRHLRSREAAVETFVGGLWMEWSERMDEAIADREPIQQLHAACLTWTKFWLEWGEAALVVRPTRGVIERHREADEDIERIWGVVATILDGLVAAEEIPEQSIEYAALVWITLLNERVVLDLHRAGWSARTIAESLAVSLLAVLRSPPSARIAGRPTPAT